MDTIEVVKKNECCGCGSCVQKCPKQAISMVENEEGFLYPQINKEKCVDCGLCNKVCPQLKTVKKVNKNIQKVYAVYNKNRDTQAKSSSGGIFTELAMYVLENNGIVYGAAYDENFKVNHIEIVKKEDINQLRKSKYIQSNINNSYKDVEKNLKENKLILFSGTPCQINGLKNFLIKEYENLITCDIVCHGVPSQKAFKQYLKYFEDKLNEKVIDYDFRCKDIKGYEKLGKLVTRSGKVKYLKIGLDCYYNNFLEGNIFRESCYNCHYSDMNRVGDITIGDYIGVLEVQPDAYSSEGTSICIINSNNGMKVFNEIKDKFNIFETTEERIKKYNSNLNQPKKRPVCRDYVYKNIDDERKFVNDLKKFMNKKSKIKSLIPNKLKLAMKKLKRR